MNSSESESAPEGLFEGQFTHINEGFTCENCGKRVKPRSSSCRNHCPFCLVSKHLDIFPGDRSHSCHGLMDVIAYELSSKKGLVLLFKCRKCGEKRRNIAAHEDSEDPDDFDQILKSGLK